MEGFKYKEIFDKTLMEIKVMRNPSSMRVDECFYNWADLQNNRFFDFGGKWQDEYEKVVEFARRKSIDTVYSIIGYMNRFFSKELMPINEFEKDGILTTAQFIILDKATKILFIFKEMEKCSYMLSDEPSDNIKDLLVRYEAKEFKFIYFLKDKAYLQQIGYKEKLNDVSKGTTAYPLIYFFETIFGIDEAHKFNEALINYISNVNSVLGYSVVKTLTNDVSINFRTIVESKILKYKYESIGAKKIGKYEIDKKDIPELINQFISKKYYRVLLGNSDFAESFVTAEWMYDSMKKASAIDFSVVALGYFKTVEQLLFEIIKLHNWGTELNEDNYTLGSIATYYKRFNSYIGTIHPFTKTYIKEAVFHYKDIRNGYSHKHNIKDIDKIEEIRDATIELIFLVLGSHDLNAKRLNELGYLKREYENDFYLLCEYMNYHAGDAFYVYAGDKEIMCFANNDMQAENVGDHTEYSGVYIKDMVSKKQYKIVSSSLPTKVILGRIDISGDRRIDKLSIEKVKIIFENGKFVGPRVLNEIEDKY
ncbi:MAG: hypothetical protein MJ133_07605 [Lachnospiraceae bacterium]|nr:hypothetical protein [Lachnospiraceae bacterium]